MKLEEMIKAKDKHIEELVRKIKSKGLTWLNVELSRERDRVGVVVDPAVSEL